jgi:RNA polymerase sigma factor (sigma-70 family)
VLHHHRDYLDASQTDRRAHVTIVRRAVDAGELERLLLASTGPGECWTAAMQRHSVRIRAVARAHRLPAHDADDVVQTTWLRLLEHRAYVRQPAALGAWLQTTARRESLRVLRENARLVPVDEDALDGEDPQLGPDARVHAGERRVVLGKAIAELPDRQRALMQALLDDSDPSYADLSRRLQMPIGSIGPTRARCFDRLRADARLTAVAGPDAGP